MKFSGSFKEIYSFMRKDGMQLSSTCESSEEAAANSFKAFGLFNNPLEGLFGYHAKHNRESELEEVKTQSIAEYTNMKIFTLEKAQNQDKDEFIAIQQLFFYFKDAAEINSKSIQQKVDAF